MTLSRSSNHWLRAFLGIAIVLSGCSGGSSATSRDGALPANPPKKSALPTQTLLYVADGVNQVLIYAYKDGVAGPQVATISISDPNGLCSDKAGDVWVASGTGHVIEEFRHGETTPVASISFDKGEPNDCAVDIQNGNLAVSVDKVYETASVQDGMVEVFRNAKTPGRKFSTAGKFAQTYYLAYDNRNDLFLQAYPCFQKGCGPGDGRKASHLYELIPGQNAFHYLDIRGASLPFTSGIAWINPELLVLASTHDGPIAVKLHVAGYSARITQEFRLKGKGHPLGVAIRAGAALVTDGWEDSVETYSVSDGKLLSSLSGITGPTDVAVSQAG